MGPSYRVAHDGQFGALIDLDQLLAGLDTLLADMPEQQRELLRQRFVNPQLLTQMAVSDLRRVCSDVVAAATWPHTIMGPPGPDCGRSGQGPA